MDHGDGFGEQRKKPKITPDMLEPLVFPKHQTQYKIFSYVVCVVITYYMVFVQDFGPREHIFSPARRFKTRMTNKFFQVDPEDKKVQAAKEELIKKNLGTKDKDKP